MEQRSQIQETQHCFHSSHSMEENVELQILSAIDDPVKECCIPLFECLKAAQCYKEVCLHDFAPEDWYVKRHWMDKLQLP